MYGHGQEKRDLRKKKSGLKWDKREKTKAERD